MSARIALVAALWAGTALLARAGALDDAAAAYARGDYALALALWRPLARVGDADAQRQLGRLYFYGLGVPKDPAQAYLWLTLAAARLPPGALREQTLYDRDRAAAKLSARQLIEVQAQALERAPP